MRFAVASVRSVTADNEPEVLLDRDGAVATITLNAPRRRNVLSVPMVAALQEAVEQAENHPDVRALVLTGTGSAFCAGAELDTLEQGAAGNFDRVKSVYDGFLRVLHSPLPTIAAVNGPAVGAGFNLALACDVRLAAPTARFDTRFAALRIHPGGGHTWLLTRAVGAQHAMLASLFGEVWTAEQARERGLVAAVHPAEDLVATATALGNRLAVQSRDYVARSAATLRLAADGTSSHEDVLKAETAAQQWSLTQPEFLEGLAAIRAGIARGR
jgi:enoyl-CoA hydratase